MLALWALEALDLCMIMADRTVEMWNITAHKLFVPTWLPKLMHLELSWQDFVALLHIHFGQSQLPYFKLFVIVGGNLDDFVLKQMRQMHTVLLIHLPLKHCGAITFRNKVVRCSQSEVISQIASFLSAVFNHVCKQVWKRLTLCCAPTLIPLNSLLLLCNIQIDGPKHQSTTTPTKLSFGCIYIPVGTRLLKGSLLQFHTSTTN